MKVAAVIIPTFNRRKKLRSVLLLLRQQITLTIDRLITVVVVDGSTDGTMEMLEKEFPEVLGVKGTGDWWYTKCVNEGLRCASANGANFFITLNDDVGFTGNFIETLLKPVLSDTRAVTGAISFTASQPHRITFSGTKAVKGWRLKEINYIEKFLIADPSNLTGLRPSVNLSGRGMAFSYVALSELGYFDERFIQYGSDTDFSFRAHKLGFRVLVSYDAQIFEDEKLTSPGALHNAPGFMTYFASQFDKHTVNSLSKAMLYYRKHGIRPLAPVYLVFNFLVSVFVYFFKIRKGNKAR